MIKYIETAFCRCKDACQQILALPDAPRFVSKGIALGFAFGFLPIPIINIPLSYLVARVLRAHGAATTLTLCLFKPMIPLYLTLNIITGSLLLGGNKIQFSININPVAEIPLLNNFLHMLTELGVTFLAGSVANAAMAGIAVFFIAFKFLEARQRLK